MRLYLSNVEYKVAQFACFLRLGERVLLDLVENGSHADELVIELVVVSCAHENLVSAANEYVHHNESCFDEFLNLGDGMTAAQRVLICGNEFKKEDDALPNKVPVKVESRPGTLLVDQQSVDDAQRHLVHVEGEILHQVRDEEFAANVQYPGGECIRRRFIGGCIAVSGRCAVQAEAKLNRILNKITFLWDTLTDWSCRKQLAKWSSVMIDSVIKAMRVAALRSGIFMFC